MVLQDEKFQSAPGSKVGTPAYLAPEVISTTRGRTYDGKVRTRGQDLNKGCMSLSGISHGCRSYCTLLEDRPMQIAAAHHA